MTWEEFWSVPDVTEQRLQARYEGPNANVQVWLDRAGSMASLNDLVDACVRLKLINQNVNANPRVWRSAFRNMQARPVCVVPPAGENFMQGDFGRGITLKS